MSISDGEIEKSGEPNSLRAAISKAHYTLPSPALPHSSAFFRLPPIQTRYLHTPSLLSAGFLP